MKRFALFVLAAFAAFFFSACTTVPTSNEVALIQNACNVDATLRPTVTALLAVPGLATPEEVLIVNTARSAIDPICANPRQFWQPRPATSSGLLPRCRLEKPLLPQM